MKTRVVPVIALCVILCGCATSRPDAGSSPDAVVQNALTLLQKNHSNLQRFVLDNGMICLIQEDHSAPVVSIQIWVGTGSIHEDEFLGAGLSHAIEHMIFKGTKTRGVGDITREIDNAGGNINAYTGSDRTVFFTDMPSAKWPVGLNVLADAVMNASFPQGEWEKEREVIRREIAMNKDDPQREVSRLLFANAYTVHPYRFPVIGIEEIFKKTTRENLISFFHRNYLPDNMITAVVGDVDASEVESRIREIFGDFLHKARVPAVLPAEPRQIAPRFERKSGSCNLSRLEWAYHTVPLSHPDAPALDLLAEIVGSGRSSRLNRKIKEELKLVHSIDASSYTPKEPGLFSISASLDPAREEPAIAAIQAEVDSWLRLPFTKMEIEKARRMLLSSTLSELQTMHGQAGSLASGEYYAADPRFSQTYLKLLGAVAPESLRTVAQRYFRPEDRTLVIMAPAAAEKTDAPRTEKTAVPTPGKIVLPNRVPLIVREDHRLPFVYVSVALGGGLLSENESNNGITRLLSNLLTRGTKTRSSDEIARAVESLGGSLSPFSGQNSFGLNAKCLTGDAATFIETLSDCLLNPSFPDDEIAKQKINQIADIDAAHEQPVFLAQETLRQILFPRHPYQWDPLGTRESLQKIERGDLVQYLRRHAVSGNMAVAIFGDITPDRARQLAEAGLRDVPAGMAPALTCERPNPTLPSRAKRREPKEQTIFLAGFPGVSLKDRRHDPLDILQTALSGLSADLSMEVREKRGLAYFVGAYQHAGVEPGAFVVYAGTREDAVNEIETLIRKEIQRIASSGIRKEEFDRARNQIITEFEMGLQDNSILAMNCALNELYGLGYVYPFTTRQRFEAITMDDVRRAAASIFLPDKMAISTVLPDKPQKKEAPPAPAEKDSGARPD